jgi:hypothetical protein
VTEDRESSDIPARSSNGDVTPAAPVTEDREPTTREWFAEHGHPIVTEDRETHRQALVWLIENIEALGEKSCSRCRETTGSGLLEV